MANNSKGFHFGAQPNESLLIEKPVNRDKERYSLNENNNCSDKDDNWTETTPDRNKFRDVLFEYTHSTTFQASGHVMESQSFIVRRWVSNLYSIILLNIAYILNKC